MSNIIPLPKSYNVRISHQRRRFKPACPVVDLAQRRLTTVPAETAYEMYLRANRIDDDQPAKAIPIYEAAIALDGRLSIAITNLGNCYFRLHQSDKAEVMWRKTLDLDPNQPEALYNLGYLALERGLPTESIPLFRRSLTADPKFADAWFNYALALEQTGKPARLEWQRYLSLAPSDCRWVEIAKRHLA
jgi:tetratricopeptide (TPR) repeat protein